MNGNLRVWWLGCVFLVPCIVLAQGQDSQPYERDLMVVGTLLQGSFDNANQSYFDRRGKRSVRHGRIHQTVEKVALDNLGDQVFLVSGYRNGKTDESTQPQLWALTSDSDTASVKMRMWLLDGEVSAEKLPPAASLGRVRHCDLYWRREAAQFRASSSESCDLALPVEAVISDKQLWTIYAPEGEDFQMHRVRQFECYADIPGVGGGRDEPFERYEGFKVHDQGGEAWFTAKSGREFGISLFLVDWPINNYDGIFARDSMVVYFSERMDGETKEHGYAFTVPEADRVGINLKWVLVNCYMNSNKVETPFM
ncbi:MAG: hypothetical protein AB8B96_04275 [Lysobacterales bacterium]